MLPGLSAFPQWAKVLCGRHLQSTEVLRDDPQTHQWHSLFLKKKLQIPYLHDLKTILWDNISCDQNLDVKVTGNLTHIWCSQVAKVIKTQFSFIWNPFLFIGCIWVRGDSHRAEPLSARLVLRSWFIKVPSRLHTQLPQGLRGVTPFCV